MTKRARKYISLDAPTDPTMTAKHLTKREFGVRLVALMEKKRWTQADLSRWAKLPRDSISRYVNGLSIPTEDNLHKLAEALGVDPNDLLPNRVEEAIEFEANPALEMKVSPSTPNAAWLRVNRLVSIDTATKIVELLSNDSVTYRK